MIIEQYTLWTFITHERRVLIVPVNDIIVIQHHNVTLAITTLQPHVNNNKLNYYHLHSEERQ